MGAPTSPIRRLALGPYNGGVRERWPVWLVGMMGSGKSTLAPPLADFLGRSWLDSDHEIERRSGCSIAELFETRGEAHFRDLERSLTMELESGDAVVALGSADARSLWRCVGVALWAAVGLQRRLPKASRKA